MNRNSVDYISEFTSLIEFVSSAFNKEVSPDDFQIEDMGVPHERPVELPRGKMAIYSFIYEGNFLKIGKVKSNGSDARYRYQHYNGGNSSTLNNSICADCDFQAAIGLELEKSTAGAWIMKNCRRVNILFDANLGDTFLGLVEREAHHRYKPKYEGRKQS